MTENLATWIENSLGHRPHDLGLFQRALTHPSHGRHAEEAEGKLAHRFNGLVSREVCADVGRDLILTPWLRLGKQALDDGVFESENVLGDVVEALIGALYLDGGMEAAEPFIRTHWAERIGGQRVPPKHPKAALQELAAARNRKPPAYAIVDRSGPDHRPHFTVKVQVNGLGEADGTGTSRQEAETVAAKALLEKLR